MGPLTVAQKSSVDQALAKLQEYAKSPTEHLFAINQTLRSLFETLSKGGKMDAAQRNIFGGVESRIYAALTPSERVTLYTFFPPPKGFAAVNNLEIRTPKQAADAMATCAKAPLFYLPQIQWLLHNYPDELKDSAAARSIKGSLLSTSQITFVEAEPIRSLNMRFSRMRDVKLGPQAIVPGRAEIEAQIPETPTEQRLLPSPQRVVSAPMKVPPVTWNQLYGKFMGGGQTPESIAAISAMSKSDQDMFLGYFRTNKKGDPTAGNAWYQALLGGIGFTATDLPDVNANPARDRRWMTLSQMTMIPVLDAQGRPLHDNMQKILDVLNVYRSGDWLKGMKTLNDTLTQMGVGNPSAAPLSTAFVTGIKNICSQMTTMVPFFVMTEGGMEGFHLKGGKITLGVHAFISQIVSQQYAVDFNEKTYALSIHPTGYTGRQMMTRAGGTVQYKPSEYRTFQLDVAVEIPQGVSDTGQAQFTGKPQALIEASFTDASGKVRILKCPLYYGLRASYRAPSNSFGLAGALGVGVGSLPTLGQVVLMVDTGWEIVKGDATYSRPMTNVITRFGLGVQPISTRTGETYPIKIYGLWGTSGEPTLLGTKVDKVIGGGAEARLWYGLRVGGEVAYRNASTISGVPLTGGKNAVIMLNVDISEVLHRWWHKGR